MIGYPASADGIPGNAVDLARQSTTVRRRSSLARHHARHQHTRMSTRPHATRQTLIVPDGTFEWLPPAWRRIPLPVVVAKMAAFVAAGAQQIRLRGIGFDTLAALPRTKLGAYVVTGLAAVSLVVAAGLSVRARVPELPGAIEPALQAHFDAVWERADLAVQLGREQRAWTWGPAPIYTVSEPYKQAAEGKHLAQYYDKGRLEIDDPANPSGVTAGLLVRELVSGQIALGADPAEVEAREPAEAPVAGDPAAINADAPTYASFHGVASLAGDRPAKDATGTPVTQTIDRQGAVGQLPAGPQGEGDDTTIATFEPTLQHNIPKAFWRFLHQQGVVYERGQARPYQPVYEPWHTATGLPITEPYWISTKVAGSPRWILVQLFERRVLTYTPEQPAPHRVEMGNSGLHYVAWRYGSAPEGDGPLRAEQVNLAPTSAEIAWSAATPLRAAVHLGTSSTSLSPLAATQEHIVSGTATLPALDPGKRYMWRVVGEDRHGRTVRSPLRGFTTPNPNAKPICLTFDDGPVAGTETVLDVLGGRVPATFFLTGANMDAHPEQQAALVLRMLREGHQLANHTFSHLPMFIPEYERTYGTLSDRAAKERFRENYAHNERHFRGLLGRDEPLFALARLPGAGQAIESGGKAIYVDATNELGLAHVGWNFELAPNGRFGQVFAMDWQGIPGIAATSPDLPAAGDVLLLHDSHYRGNGEPLAAVIEMLSRNGYTFGRIDQAGACVAP